MSSKNQGNFPGANGGNHHDGDESARFEQKRKLADDRSQIGGAIEAAEIRKNIITRPGVNVLQSRKRALLDGDFIPQFQRFDFPREFGYHALREIGGMYPASLLRKENRVQSRAGVQL